jgi:HEAT repeat protein
MGLRRPTDVALHPVSARKYPRDRDGLQAQLQDEDAAVRRWAVRDLALLPDIAAVLGARLRDEADPSVREALFTALGGQPTTAAVDVLLPLLRSEDAGLRNGAIETLALMPDLVGPRIDALLRDDDPDVRLFTVNLLTQLRHAQVGRWLDRVLHAEPHVNVVAGAIEVLTEIGGHEHREGLRSAARRFPDDPFIAFAIDLVGGDTIGTP